MCTLSLQGRGGITGSTSKLSWPENFLHGTTGENKTPCNILGQILFCLYFRPNLGEDRDVIYKLSAQSLEAPYIYWPCVQCGCRSCWSAKAEWTSWCRRRTGRLPGLPLRFCHLFETWAGLLPSLGFSFHVHQMKKQEYLLLRTVLNSKLYAWHIGGAE